MTRFILRVRFSYSLRQLENQLDHLFQYCIPSLIQQTDRDFVCFIEYSPKITKQMLSEKNKYSIIDKRFFFTSVPAKDTHAYLAKQNLKECKDIRFVVLSSSQVFPKTMLKTLRNYQPHTKVILLKDQYLFNTTYHKVFNAKMTASRSFVYVCPLSEYRRLFFMYDSTMPLILGRYYMNMPHETINIPTLTRLTSVNNSMISGKPLADDLASQLLKTYSRTP